MKRIIKEYNGLHQYVRRSIQVCGQHVAFIPIKRRDCENGTNTDSYEELNVQTWLFQSPHVCAEKNT